MSCLLPILVVGWTFSSDESAISGEMGLSNITFMLTPGISPCRPPDLMDLTLEINKSISETSGQ